MSSKKLIQQLVGQSDDDRLSRTILEEELSKTAKKDPAKFKRLRNHVWGIGIEHEAHIFHRPKYHAEKPIEEFIMYNTKPAVENLLYRSDLDDFDRDFLKRIPFELSGRKCFDEFSLKPVPIEMPEFITDRPFSSLATGKRPIEFYCSQIIKQESDFFQLLQENKLIREQTDTYGQLAQYPFGMSNFIRIPKSFGKAKYAAYNKQSYTDYLGSFHLTLTLPFTEKTKKAAFIKMHQNFGNQLQWIEPLLIAAFFSADQASPGSKEKRIKGSFRVLRIGWGNLAGSDVRQFSKGIGRYAVIKPYWRDDLNYYDKEKTEICEGVSNRIRKDSPRAVSGFSSNFRTFGSTDPERPMHRESGLGMTPPNGIEFRIFDNFDARYLNELCQLVVYVAENSRVHRARDYVYKNKHWIRATRDIMLNGWTARVSDGYVALLRKNLGLRIATASRKAYDVLLEINNELWKKNRDGDWTYLMLDRRYPAPPILPQINRRSWEFALMIKLNRYPKLNQTLQKFVGDLDKETDWKEWQKRFFKVFAKERWERDVEGVAYFLQSIDAVNLKIGKRGDIEYIVKKDGYKGRKNYNYDIIKEWDRAAYLDTVKILTKHEKLTKSLKGDLTKQYELLRKV